MLSLYMFKLHMCTPLPPTNGGHLHNWLASFVWMLAPWPDIPHAEFGQHLR